MPNTTIITGDCRAILPTLPANSLDACVTDPPYEIGFMGNSWDKRGVAFDPATWAEVFRVLKPGAHTLAFGGTRTFHRMAVAIEDAGFEIRDCVMWVYGTGFPKSHDTAKAIHAALTVGGSSPRNRRQAQMGADYVEGETAGLIGVERAMERVRSDAKPMDADVMLPEARQWQGWGTALKPAWEPVIVARKPLAGTVAGNVLSHGTGAMNIDGCRVPGVESTRRQNTAEIGYHGNKKNLAVAYETGSDTGRWPANFIHDGSDEVLSAFAMRGEKGEGLGARGSGAAAARFFYSAKASKADRAGSSHPTVKPVSLMRYLCKLVTPPGGTVLDPFAGSGTTGEAALREGFCAVLIEAETKYVSDIRARMCQIKA